MMSRVRSLKLAGKLTIFLDQTLFHVLYVLCTCTIRFIAADVRVS